MKYFWFIILISQFTPVWAQTIRGTVTEKKDEGNQPLVGANVFWLGTTQGVITDAAGNFTLNSHPTANKLIISYVGYVADTLEINDFSAKLEIALEADQLKSVVVTAQNQLSQEIITSQTITRNDLRKAACCNLSESFETNGTVDVSTTDAVGGTKQIRMLGLDGIYVQMTAENIPWMRGLAIRNGLNLVPGTWIKAIDINKGSGSVVNGYESITGQINVELIPPDNTTEKVLLNGYVNQFGRSELNANWSQAVGAKLSTATLVHGSILRQPVDMNDDGFMDTPQFDQINLMHRWKYNGEKLKIQWGVNVLQENRWSGQNNFSPRQAMGLNLPYGNTLQIRRLQGFSKIGFLSDKREGESLGLILSATRHEQSGQLGLNPYLGLQTHLNAHLIYSRTLGPQHEIRTGGSFTYESTQERFEAVLPQVAFWGLNRLEQVAGAFLEHTFKPSHRWAIVSGLRLDYHNLIGLTFNPRLHVKYDITSTTILRFSAGRGLRFANPFAEAMSYLFSNRQVVLGAPLKPEIAINIGLSLSQQFMLANRKGLISIEGYRTTFENQVVNDLDTNPQTLLIANVANQGFAHSIQFSLDYQLARGLQLQTSYKWYDVQTLLNGVMRSLPFVAQHRFLGNLSYETGNAKWKFDITLKWIGAQRLPNTDGNPQAFQTRRFSPDYFLWNGQITRTFGRWDVYVGGENLGNFIQPNPVIQAENPYGNYFDASLIWAPVMGRMIYAGFRFTIQ